VVKNRAQYLNAIVKFYTHSMQFHNQNLLWETYIKPYFTYMAAVIDTQAKTTQNKIHSAWRNSFKKFCNLPTNTSRNIINQIIKNQELTCELASIKNESKIQKRNKTLISANQQNTTEEKLNTRLQHETRRRKLIYILPKSYKLLLYKQT
jgi:hypothetical protein